MHVIVQEVWFLIDQTKATNGFLNMIMFFQGAMHLVVGSQRFTGICRLQLQNKFSDCPYQAIHK